MTSERHADAADGGWIPGLDGVRPSASVGLALGIAAAWIVLEVALRRGAVPHLASLVGTPFGADWAMLAVGFPAVAGLLSWIAVRRGSDPAEWGYEWSARSVVAGVVGIGAVIAVTAVTGRIDSALFGLEGVEAAFTAAVGDAVRATPALAVLLLVGNGVLGPLAEEQVWRGIVQSELVDSWGAVAGIAATAVLFALKHVVVDLSVARLTTLLALGLAFGILRHRFGTVSSAITHVGVNTISSAALVAVALG